MGYENEYHKILRLLLEAPERKDRTGTGTKSLFGYHFSVNLAEGYPLLTTRRIHFKSIVYELFWFLNGDTNIKYLNENGVTIWDEWADEHGDLGPIYGYQWRRWPGRNGEETYDQIRNVIEEIKRNPYSRRLVVSSWNVSQLNLMRLLPCHVLYQFYVEPHEKRISVAVYQRSADVFLGLPFNVASYALLLHMIGHVTGYTPHKVHFFLGDMHLYLNHQEQAKLLLTRTPFPLPKIELNKDIRDIDDFDPRDIKLIDYRYHPPIYAPVSV